jgi:uncharacterized UBP type Zn finger protein
MDSVKKCPECVKIFGLMASRAVDGKCLECGSELCAAHLLIHFRDVHFMQIYMDTDADQAVETGKEA